jgi:FlaA1/EpsC-like NDP-sugar epimerase
VSLPARLSELAMATVRRQTPLFAADCAAHSDAVAARVQGKRVLVVGGAGSIGSATAAQLARYSPAQLHVVDTDENGLTELVRDLRSQGIVSGRTELRTTPLDAGSPTMIRLLQDNRGYDLVLNFAAVKHVRSEKDLLSLLRMLDVNLRITRRLLEENLVGKSERYFAVSTDKAANPVNLMGASKRAMEHLLLDEDLGVEVTSARFANVAFSQGSLLDGWLRRLAKRQPWAVPAGARRFFVTLEEAGQLCLLAATAAPAGKVIIPDLNPATELRDLVEVAHDVLGVLGLRADLHDDEDSARRAAQSPRPGTWPVLVTRLDTAGEKDYEEFVAPGDVVQDAGFVALKALTVPTAEKAVLRSTLAEVEAVLADPNRPVDVASITALITRIVPELAHKSSALTLDARM